MLGPQDRKPIARELPALAKRYPKLLMNEGIARTILRPPSNPDDCLFPKMSANYSADLKSRVEPCVFGGVPDCSQCGCAISSGLHWVKPIKLAGPVNQSLRAEFYQCGPVVHSAAPARDAANALDTRCVEARCQTSRRPGANSALRFSCYGIPRSRFIKAARLGRSFSLTAWNFSPSPPPGFTCRTTASARICPSWTRK
jgi:hypothetical protein